MSKVRKGGKKNFYIQKKKKSNYEKTYKVVIIILSIIAIGGILYILYDMFKEKIDNSLQKLFGTKIENTLYNNSNSRDNLTKETIGKEELEVIQNLETNLSQQKAKEVETNLNTAKKETNKLQTIEKELKTTSKIFFYRVLKNNLVLSSKKIETKQNSIYELFKLIKRLKSSDNEITFLNPSTRLIDYKLSDDTLILNLSKEIEENEYGGNGILYSIYQIAYTLGYSANVKKVLILIEGKKPSYLGGEGIIFQNPIDITKKPIIQ